VAICLQLLGEVRPIPPALIHSLIFNSHLTAASVKPQMPLEKDSVAVRILYESVCSPWPLILWVTFRMVQSETDSTDSLAGFLEILRKDSSPAELFAWDDEDDLELMQRLDWPSAIHADSWSQYMVEVPPKDWLLIRNLTCTPSGRPRRPDTSSHDLSIRLAALFLTYSMSAFIAPDAILAPLGISFDNSIFAFMTQVMNSDKEYHMTPAHFELPEFWASPKLENRLTEPSRKEELCHAVWQNIPGPSGRLFQRVECLYPLLITLPQVSLVHRLETSLP
jgi:hypothetical protein